MQFNHEFDVKVLRSVVDGYNFAQQKKVDDILDDTDTHGATFIHHRKATFGKISYDNCHPFEHSDKEHDVIGVHNGSLTHFNSKEDGKTFEVDSDWLYHRIHRDGAPATLGAVKGAYALVWAERPSNKIYIAGNDERPIHWAKVKGRNTILVASEAAMLYWLASRNSITIEQIYRPQDGFIYEFDIMGSLEDIKKIPLIVPKAKPVARRSLPDIEYKPKGQYIPDTGAMQYQTKDEIVEDWFGPRGLEGAPFRVGEEVDFSYKETVSIQDNAKYTNVFGEILAADASIHPCLMNWVAIETASNVKESTQCWTKIIGRREVTDKKTGVVKKYFLVGPPFMVELKEGTPKQEVPWSDEAEAVWNTLLGATDTGSEDRMVKGPKGEITSLRFKHMVKDGCGCCSRDLGIKDADKIGWVNDNTPICESCIATLATDSV